VSALPHLLVTFGLVTFGVGVLVGFAAASALVWRWRRALTVARFDAAHDALTGLPNRSAALAHVHRAVAQRRAFGLVLLDLDRFKTVNDTYGHAAGDDLLVQVAARLAELAHLVGFAARLHGDEFVLLVDDDTGDDNHLHAAARAAWAAIATTPFSVAGRPVWVQASVGYTRARPGATGRQVIADADSAMYQAKTTGTGLRGHVPASVADSQRRRRWRDTRHRQRTHTTRPPRPLRPREDLTTMATDLFFDLPAVLRLAEHAHAATGHAPSISEHLDGQRCPGGLEWVADWGTYLMSTGLPGLRVNPDDPTSGNVVVYADGWGPDSDRHSLAATDVGGDDFVEHLHLADNDFGLLHLLRTGAQHGYPWFVITVDGDHFGFSAHRDDPAGTA
jgi:diguanylate cyclase (GGDEF)-like protein